MELLAVEDNRQSGVEEHVILQQTLDIFVFILVILEYLFVWDEIGERPVCLLRRQIGVSSVMTALLYSTACIRRPGNW